MPQLSLLRLTPREVADFMTSAASTQRRIVRTNKYPASTEAKAIVTYYQPARTAAEHYFAKGRSNQVIEEEMRQISAQAGIASPARRARLKQNVRAIQDFQRSSLASRPLQALLCPRIKLTVGSVEIPIRPSLLLRDQAGQESWMFLDFSETVTIKDRADILLQLFIQAARSQKMPPEFMHAEHHHFHSGQHQTVGKSNARLEAHIFASCQTFCDIWASI